MIIADGMAEPPVFDWQDLWGDGGPEHLERLRNIVGDTGGRLPPDLERPQEDAGGQSGVAVQAHTGVGESHPQPDDAPIDTGLQPELGGGGDGGWGSKLEGWDHPGAAGEEPKGATELARGSGVPELAHPAPAPSTIAPTGPVRARNIEPPRQSTSQAMRPGSTAKYSPTTSRGRSALPGRGRGVQRPSAVPRGGARTSAAPVRTQRPAVPPRRAPQAKQLAAPPAVAEQRVAPDNGESSDVEMSPASALADEQRADPLEVNMDDE
ncbi:hypothetical protein CALVIDRAFT_89332 [Calocera viscosa TUFC12733]|uniref:Uncharacterized protein n=1 Tax=Calocera viscosa (strain TUFC12733) TaxID=1330018 RepID=A0A167FFC3_CALVF|nr:hypothetical protein CALVIDRAFT_89332 [Calocera viscosa TUFC12733]